MLGGYCSMPVSSLKNAQREQGLHSSYVLKLQKEIIAIGCNKADFGSKMYFLYLFGFVCWCISLSKQHLSEMGSKNLWSGEIETRAAGFRGAYTTSVL